jgi:Flp pilus assembly protein protease CpaA
LFRRRAGIGDPSTRGLAMSTCLETSRPIHENVVPRTWGWRGAVILPLLLAAPWLILCRSLGAPAELGTVRGLLLVLLLGTATVTDLLRRRIYNWTTYTAFGWVVVLELLTLVLGGEKAAEGETSVSAAVVSALGMLPWRDSLMGFAAGFSILFVLYNLFRGGAGDLKLVAVLGALVGMKTIVAILIYSYILAGIFAACLMVGVAGPASMLAFALRGVGIAGRGTGSTDVADCLKRQVPMAPFIAGGTLLALILP